MRRTVTASSRRTRMVPCPRCEAHPGDPCWTSTGTRARHEHSTRFYKAHEAGYLPVPAAPSLTNTEGETP